MSTLLIILLIFLVISFFGGLYGDGKFGNASLIPWIPFVVFLIVVLIVYLVQQNATIY